MSGEEKIRPPAEGGLKRGLLGLAVV